MSDNRLHIYLAGPMRGYRGYNHPAFNVATSYLREAGFVVFSPAEEDQRKFPDRDWSTMTGDPVVDGISLPDMRSIIKADLVWIADNADILVLLPGWERSKGVAVEKALAEFLGLRVWFFDMHTMALRDSDPPTRGRACQSGM